MVVLNSVFRLIRIVVFGKTSLFALIVIILGGLDDTRYGGFFPFLGLSIATGVLTLLTLPLMLFISLVRKNAFTSMIAVEIGWTWFLWIMWIAVGGTSASILSIDCDCPAFPALTAFAFLSWIFLMFYHITLSTLTLRQHMRGYTAVWTGDVTETDFNATGGGYNTEDTSTVALTNVGAPVSIAQQQNAGSYTASPSLIHTT